MTNRSDRQHGSPGARSLTGRLAVIFGIVAVGLLTGVAAAGESAAVPGLGAATWYPPWDAGLRPGSAVVTALLVMAAASGTACVLCGLLATRAGARVQPRALVLTGLTAVLMFTAVPPLGSADHLSYVTYGRIAAAGDDPYVVDPLLWRDGQDPVAGAVQPPWQHTPSVYGPVATAAQAAVAFAGGGSLRLTVWFWQLLAGAAFLATGFVLDRLTRHDPAGRTRAAVLWTLNPLLLGQLVLGAHLDVIAVSAAVGALALAARRPVVAGALLGTAVGSKITFGLFALAILWGLRTCPRPLLVRRVGLGLAGAAAVLVPAHLWAGPHVYDQVHEASRMVALATVWRPLTDALDPVFGGVVRTVLGPAALVCGIVLAALLARRLRHARTSLDRDPDGGTVTQDATRAAVLLAAAWVLTTPYSLPWYDGMVWGPLALLAGGAGSGRLTGLLLVRLSVLTLAYVPGRVVGMTPAVEDLTLGFRSDVAPWLALMILAGVVSWAMTVIPPAAPEPARSPR